MSYEAHTTEYGLLQSSHRCSLGPDFRTRSFRCYRTIRGSMFASSLIAFATSAGFPNRSSKLFFRHAKWMYWMEPLHRQRLKRFACWRVRPSSCSETKQTRQTGLELDSIEIESMPPLLTSMIPLLSLLTLTFA